MQNQFLNKAEIVMNVNLKSLKTKQAQKRYKVSFMRLMNEYKDGKISLQEFSDKAKERFNELNQKIKA